MNQAAPDYAGFVFAKKSKRFISPKDAEKLRQRINPEIITVGVFVDEDPKNITKIYKNGVFSVVQLHGCETASYIRTLKDMCPAPVIKALSCGKKSAEEIIAAFSTPADYLLLDSSSGGSGELFDWSVLNAAKSGLNAKPYFLAGGVNALNINAALKYKPYAIDVSSGAETNGFKDLEKMRILVEKVRNSG